MKIRGGMAERLGVTSRDVSSSELRRGQKHELEHTDDPKLAKQIALDHLAEDPHYYAHITAMEKAVKRKSKGRRITAKDLLKGLRR